MHRLSAWIVSSVACITSMCSLWVRLVESIIRSSSQKVAQMPCRGADGTL